MPLAVPCSRRQRAGGLMPPSFLEASQLLNGRHTQHKPNDSLT